MPRFDQSFTGICEQNHQDTQLLKQRYLEPKAKRPSKPKDKKQSETISSSVHVQQKFLKRPSDEHEQGGGGGGGGGGDNINFEPPVKLQCTTQQHGSQDQEGLTKFSVQIVQQLEFTSAANSQPQQISTNVTVKAHTNASIKSDVSSPKPPSAQPPQQAAGGGGAGAGSGGGTTLNAAKGGGADVGSLIDCVKQEPISDFADLEECAAAVEKDAAANGAMSFGNITDLIGDDTNDELFTSSAFKALIKDIANLNEFNFDFDDKQDDLKLDDSKDLKLNSLVSSLSMEAKPTLCNQGSFAPPTASRIPPYLNADFGKTELSPAAQTLKQMAEQHQHQKQMGLSFNPAARPPPNARSPYPEFPLNEYAKSAGVTAANTNAFHPNAAALGPELIKQEMTPFPGSSDYELKRKSTAGLYKQQQQQQQQNQQQYSPYGSPNPGSHGSPGYLPNRNNAPGSNAGAANNNSNGGNYGAGATPPRPPSVTGSAGTTTLHINQAQSIHISQQNPGHNIQVSAGQHLHLSGDLKGNVSIATHQGMHFQQQGQQHAQPSQQSHHHGGGGSAPAAPNANAHGPQVNEVGPMNIPQQQQAQQPVNSSSMMNEPLHQTSMNNMAAPMMGGMNGIGGPHHNLTAQMPESYSMSQSQTINFTQQTLRQRGSASSMPPNIAMANQMVAPITANSIRSMSPIEQQKLMQQQQQQMLRAQQQVAMQQQHIVRPPPPEYKASAGLVQNMGPRYTVGAQPTGAMAGNLMRRIPPSGPIVRPSHNMYMMQQQQPQVPQSHMPIRGMYPRQPAAMGSAGAAIDIPNAGNPSLPQHGSPEWRHLMMQQQQQHQQQGNNFSNQLRPTFQQHHSSNKPFSMNPTHMAMSPHLRPPIQAAASNLAGMGQMPQLLNQQNVGSMTQMNQQMMMQQQQQLAVQANSQMSMNNVQVQQTQSLSIGNHSIHQSSGQSHQNLGNQQMVAPMSTNQPQMANQNNDFLDILGIQTDSALSEQELLTFASDSGFNLNDITF